MKNVRIFSEQNFVLEIDGKNYYLDDTNHIDICGCSKDVIVKAYPVEQEASSIPFCFKLSSVNGNIESLTKNIKTYNLPSRCDVFVSPFLISQGICLYTNYHTIKNVRYTVACYGDKIKISSNKGEYTYEQNLDSAESYSDANNIKILTKHKNTKTFVVFSCQKNIFSKVSGNKIEINENKISTLSYINDMAKHVKVSKYTLLDDIKKDSDELFMESENAKKCTVSCLVPYNFFEAIKCGDFSLAKTFLSESLCLTSEAMKQYFGEFKEIKLFSVSPLVYTLYKDNEARDYHIEMLGDKIVDISD